MPIVEKTYAFKGAWTGILLIIVCQYSFNLRLNHWFESRKVRESRYTEVREADNRGSHMNC